ncbi:YchJ family protein [Microbacterium sp. 179-B 1A2 NHS]|uniref:YchJ family protein n=1 Tax=Microbacterium sp. 179-B 1A2 NHS TaxID=3142383 RepID=UPI00399F063F
MGENMSFGAAASVPRGTRPAAGDPCPCGGGAFGACCGPILAGDAAPTAERLMRSRYTAFAVGDAQHLRDTWFPATRPATVALDAATRWRRLEIVATGGEPGADSATVRFRASWADERSRRGGVMEEDSRFVRRSGRWYYVDAV